MRILIVTGIFPPDHGGPASYVPTIARKLAARGHEVTGVITLSEAPSSNGENYPFPVIRIPRKQNYAWRWIQTVKTIILESRKADVVYLNGLVLEGIVAAKILGCRPVVIKVVGDLIWERARNQHVTELGLDSFQTSPLPLKWQALRSLQSWYMAKADAVITPSAYLARIVGGWGVAKNKIKVVYNAVEQATTSTPSEPTFDLVSVARLVPWKGLSDLIAAAGEQGLSLRIVGDGPMRAQLEAEAKAQNAKVSFAGHVEHEQVAVEIQKGRLFVLYSDYEGLPHIVLEAKAAGTPVLASAVGGTPETIEHNVDGWLIAAANRAALKKAIGRLLNDAELRARLASSAKADVSKRFSLDHMVSDTENVLRSVAL